MNVLSRRFIYALLYVIVMSFGTVVTTAAERKPNVVLIMADDFGYEAVSANGGESYRTPNLDRLAAGGMRFEHCHVQPLCTPTRVQLMTGIYNIRNYVDFQLMDPKVTTFGQLLKKAGYATAIAGKWQLGTDPNGPRDLGFDESVLWQLTRRPPRYANPGLEINGKEKDYDNGEYGPKLINDFALDFVTRHKDRAFFLYYPMILTHDPFQPTPDSRDWDPKAKGETNSFSKEKVNLNVKYFADMTAYMDKMVGRLVAKIDELGLRENTLILFLGDNGTDVDVVSRFKGQPYRGGKGTRTARGTHVPFIANWPGNIPAGRVNTDLIGSVDFLPTICDVAGAPVPTSLQIDGRSFRPQLLGQTGDPREWLYVWYARYGGPTAMFEFVLSKQHKLYRDGAFYDLAADPFEEKPALRVPSLTGAQAAAARKLQAALDQYSNVRPPHLMQHTARSSRGD
jgi:arylsulfatase A